MGRAYYLCLPSLSHKRMSSFFCYERGYQERKLFVFYYFQSTALAKILKDALFCLETANVYLYQFLICLIDSFHL
jgi:hypothetical protein